LLSLGSLHSYLHCNGLPMRLSGCNLLPIFARYTPLKLCGHIVLLVKIFQWILRHRA
jgi:hypothetical protein